VMLVLVLVLVVGGHWTGIGTEVGVGPVVDMFQRKLFFSWASSSR
jgi:hypothetical protein